MENATSQPFHNNFASQRYSCKMYLTEQSSNPHKNGEYKIEHSPTSHNLQVTNILTRWGDASPDLYLVSGDGHTVCTQRIWFLLAPEVESRFLFRIEICIYPVYNPSLYVFSEKTPTIQLFMLFTMVQ